ncbi:hypothetical protein PYV02_15340, partial [Leifsonia sp. H3M29-4]|uniref:hypothetical protein n=1 Tax=Salinibacterium metalliresistens TaxID=3031321 RepID=UPI0023DAE220
LNRVASSSKVALSARVTSLIVLKKTKMRIWELQTLAEGILQAATRVALNQIVVTRVALNKATRVVHNPAAVATKVALNKATKATARKRRLTRLFITLLKQNFRRVFFCCPPFHLANLGTVFIPIKV